MVILGRVVGARNHGTLSPRLATTALDVNASSSDIPQLGESARELHKTHKKSITNYQIFQRCQKPNLSKFHLLPSEVSW
jgi:hypothetical protein